jgi:hypothetical protein
VLKMRDKSLIGCLFLVYQKCSSALFDSTWALSDCEFVNKGHHKLIHPTSFKRFYFAVGTKHGFIFGVLCILKFIEATLTE